MDAKSWETLIMALDRNTLFYSPRPAVPSRFRRDAMIKPNEADIGRAVTNIRVWQKYLPRACVAAMIKDGWQWST